MRLYETLQFLHIKTRAVFVGKFSMAVNGGIRKLFQKCLNESPERIFLCRSAGVLRPTSGVESPNVADADGVGIVALAVGSDHFEWATGVDAAVTIDDVVVANHLEAPLPMPAVDVRHGIVLSLGSGGTVDDELGDLSHNQNLIFSTQNAQNTQNRMMQIQKVAL